MHVTFSNKCFTHFICTTFCWFKKYLTSRLTNDGNVMQNIVYFRERNSFSVLEVINMDIQADLHSIWVLTLLEHNVHKKQFLQWNCRNITIRQCIIYLLMELKKSINDFFWMRTKRINTKSCLESNKKHRWGDTTLQASNIPSMYCIAQIIRENGCACVVPLKVSPVCNV